MRAVGRCSSRFLRRAPFVPRPLLSARPFAKGSCGARPLTRWAAVPPAFARRSRVAPSVIYTQGQDKRKAPLRSVPSVALSAPSAPLLGVACRLPLASNRRRGSFRLYTLAPSPRRFPPAPPFPRLRSVSGALAGLPLRGLPARRWRFPPPKQTRELRTCGRASNPPSVPPIIGGKRGCGCR